MRVQPPSLVILVQVDGLVKRVQLVFLAPVLGVFELLECFVGDKLARSQVAEQSLVIVARRGSFGGPSEVLLRLAQVLEALQGVLLALCEVPDMSGRVLRNVSSRRPGGLWRGTAGVPTWYESTRFRSAPSWPDMMAGWLVSE